MAAFIPYSEDCRAEAAERFITWLTDTVVNKARGADRSASPDRPNDRIWLGRVAPTSIAAASGRDNRLERLEPCAIGLRVRPSSVSPWSIHCTTSLVLWKREAPRSWRKTDVVRVEFEILVDPKLTPLSVGQDKFTEAFATVGVRGLSAEIQIIVEKDDESENVLTVSLVNTSDPEASDDPRFYEAQFAVTGLETKPFLLDALEDSFRYDRRVPAYGINCGVLAINDGFVTTDAPKLRKYRPAFWGSDSPEPDMSFTEVARDPVAIGRLLHDALDDWGGDVWAADFLKQRASKEGWSEAMVQSAQVARADFAIELERLNQGVSLLQTNQMIHKSFCLMNEAMVLLASKKNYDGWRPFQLAFLLSNLSTLLDSDEDRDIVDIVWFATGGGKTETYLGLLMTAAFYDRLRGKLGGVTAWSRFPLRLLSLQQMQRFADAMASAEIVRRRHQIQGHPFSVGFLVGDNATPNRVRRPEQDERSRYDPDDPNFPKRFRMIQRCPFCGSVDLKMKFDTGSWTLQHCCGAGECPWPEKALPFYIVDEELFRFLPTVVVGTLDKAALIGWQQAMRGMFAAPRGCCSRAGHGFTYNPSSRSPNGCLVPDCKADIDPLPWDAALFGPTFRLQDELHLLRDSLGAVDGHYEAALDGIQQEATGRRPKILASSATLSGYQKQCDVLYRRRARVFPQPGPSPNDGFWSVPTTSLMRNYMAIAPRGATIEFAVDRLLSELQIAVRRLETEPKTICAAIDVDERFASFLVSQYGTNVIYGNTLRDLDAVGRSARTQLVGEDGPITPVNIVSLTGRTQFEDVARTLDLLQGGDEARSFDDRIHVITASSMMSHGVDVDRLNIMIVLGLPLTTAEFIQATSRVGRRWPALVLVVHKMGRERDAGVFRSFEKFVEQGDRFVEPIPITKRSRRVLERTIPGLEMARLLHVHAPTFEGRFTTVKAVQHSLQIGEIVPSHEEEALVGYLEFDAVTEAEHIADIDDALERYFDRLSAPGQRISEWFGSVWVKKPMTSLRDVEESVPVHLKRDQ
jgi:Helicase conserved C-terminal domain